MTESPITLAAGVFLIIGGAIWILQGFGVAYAPESFMTDKRWWVLWGAFSFGVGLVLILRSRRKE